MGSHGGGKTHAHTHASSQRKLDDRKAQGSRQVSLAFNSAKIRVGGGGGCHGCNTDATVSRVFMNSRPDDSATYFTIGENRRASPEL